VNEDAWEDEEDSRSAWLAMVVAVAAVVGGVLLMLVGMPFMLMVPFVLAFAVLWLLHWLITEKWPERPLGFWTGYAIDWALGAWMLVTLVAAYRHGAWHWLEGIAVRLGQVEPARPDAVFGAIAFAFLGLQALRLGEDAPWGDWLATRIPVGLLHLVIKVGLLVALVVFLERGGEELVKSWFPPR
jgi:hypothetical protein